MLSNGSQGTSSTAKAFSGSENATEISTRPSTVSSASSPPFGLPGSLNSILEQARQGTLSPYQACKVDIFASLRTYNGYSSSDAEAQSGIISPQELQCDKLYRVLERMLGDMHDSKNKDIRQGHIISDDNDLSDPDYNHIIHQVDENSVKGFEHMYALLGNFNESVSNVSAPHVPLLETEYDIYDNERLRRLRDEHIANPGAQRQKQKHAINERMSKAERDNDTQAYERAALEKQLLNHEIILDFRTNLLSNLKDDMKDVISKRLVDIDQMYDTLQAELALSMPKGRTVLQLVEEAETARKEALIQVEDILQAIDDGYLAAAEYFLQTANHLARKATTRFRRLDAHDVPMLRREEIMHQRLQDPAAAPFIARAHHEVEDVKTISEMVGLNAEKIGVHLGDLEVAFKDMERKQEGALLGSLQSGVSNAGHSTGRLEQQLRTPDYLCDSRTNTSHLLRKM